MFLTESQKKLCYIIESLGQYQCNESVRAADLVASWSLWNVAWNKSAAQTSQRMFIKFNSEQRKQTVEKVNGLFSVGHFKIASLFVCV